MVGSRFSLALLAVKAVYALPQAPAAPAVTTAVPAPALPSTASLPPQAPLPPKQAWCPSEIFCAGEVLQTVNLAYLYPDSKTFADKPTTNSSNVTLAAFDAIPAPPTIGAISTFVQQHFQGEGLELAPLALNNTSIPKFLRDNSTVPGPIARAWSAIVHGYWSDLIRNTDETTLCTGGKCESSLIPLNHTFVVPGGRFREQYYWDSFWIVEGLLKSELYEVVKNTLENFMDEIERFGFIPNGGRIYYLNRSQPPVFIHMLRKYVQASNDTSILTRALPLAEAELQWWATNRTIEITSPYSQQKRRVAHYAVVNSAPRPESYREDYLTANGPDLATPYTEEQKANLYAELASGAESGWDYSSRWTTNPWANAGNHSEANPLLRALNVRGTIAVDLNSILYKAMVYLAELYELSGGAASSVSKHRQDAASMKDAILDLMWDSSKLAFYDFNATSNSRSGFFSAAAFYPLWNDIWPAEVLADEKKMQGVFSSVGLVLSKYNGTFPATFMTTGMQWDAPNTWPPHQYIVIQALSKVPANVSTTAYPKLNSTTTSFSLVPPNQLGLGENQLPIQVYATGGNMSNDASYRNGTWTTAGVVGGKLLDGSVADSNETWSEALLRGMVNRYFSSVYCSWYSTGGSIPGLVQQLSPELLNVTHSTPASTGHMYEKLNLLDVDAAGSGGEYTVQAGFGWTNGAVLWAAAEYGKLIAEPECPEVLLDAKLKKSTDSQSKSAGDRTSQAPSLPLLGLIVTVLGLCCSILEY